jgi:hypothetical protein
MEQNVIKQIRALVAEKRSLADREKQLIAELARALPAMGYELVPTSANGSRMPAQEPGTPQATRRKPLACPHCDRRFANTSNLGRHVSASHGKRRKVA